MKDNAQGDEVYMTFSYRPDSMWTSMHQLTINGKRSSLTIDDLRACGRSLDISERRIKDTLKTVIGVVRNWEHYAEYVGLKEQIIQKVKICHEYSDIYTDYEPVLFNLQGVVKDFPQAYRSLRG